METAWNQRLVGISRFGFLATLSVRDHPVAAKAVDRAAGGASGASMGAGQCPSRVSRCLAWLF
jgi:hypothetical protein